MQTIQHQAEENLYSIIKTVEFLVSTIGLKSLNFLSSSRNLLILLVRSPALSTTTSSAVCFTNINFALNLCKDNLPGSKPLWINIISRTACQPRHCLRAANQTIEARRLIETWLKGSSILQPSSSRQWMCSLSTSSLLTSSCLPSEMSWQPCRTTPTCPLITKASLRSTIGSRK